MKHAIALLLATGLAAPAASAEDRSAEQIIRDQEAVTRYYLAAAEAEGDALSDAYMLKLLALPSGDPVARAEFDPTLVARLEVVSAELAARVQAARNDDPVLLASQLRCHPAARMETTCQEDLARLAELAGDNAYHHFLVMGHAWAREDAGTFLRHARLAAEAPAFRPDVDVVYRSVYERLKRVPDSLMPRSQDYEEKIPAAGMVAMSIAAAFALPSYQNYVQPCRESEGELREHCLAIARRLFEESTSAIDVHIASAIFKELGEPAQQARAQAMVDRLNWQVQNMRAMEERFDRHQWQAYFDAYAEGGESAAYAYAANVMGYPAEPPPGWSPRNRSPQ